MVLLTTCPFVLKLFDWQEKLCTRCASVSGLVQDELPEVIQWPTLALSEWGLGEVVMREVHVPRTSDSRKDATTARRGNPLFSPVKHPAGDGGLPRGGN